MSRVLVLVPFALDDEGLANREAQLSDAGVSSDVFYDFRPVKAGPASFQSPHDWMLLDVAILEAGLGAELGLVLCVDEERRCLETGSSALF